MRRPFIITALLLWLAVLGLCFTGYLFQGAPGVDPDGADLIWNDLGSVLELHRLFNERGEQIAVLTGPGAGRKVHATRKRLQDLHRRQLEQLKPLTAGPDAVAVQARKLARDFRMLSEAEAAHRSDLSSSLDVARIRADTADQLGRLQRMVLDRTRRVFTEREAARQNSAWLFVLAALFFTLFIGGAVVLLERRILAPLRNLEQSVHSTMQGGLVKTDSTGAGRAVKALLDAWNEATTLQRFQLDRARQRALRTRMTYTSMFSVLEDEAERALKSVRSGAWFQDEADGAPRAARPQDVEQVLYFLKEFAAYGLLPGEPEVPADEFTDVNHLLRDVVARGRSYLERKYLDIRYQAPDALVSLDVHADFEQMKRAFMNLVAFIFKVARPRTSISFQLRPREPRHAELEVTFHSDATSAEEIRCLLNRFRKSDRTDTASRDLLLIRLGMSLSLVNYAIHRVGGSLCLEERKDGSIAFVCRVPLARPIPVTAPDEVPKLEPDRSPVRS